ncbi:MAG: enhanced intracellular survival protein Eis [Bacillota bacterium]
MDIRTIRPDELNEFLAINAYAFAWDEPTLERLRGLIPPHEVRAAFVEGQMVGGVWATPLSIWMDDREVPMTGIAAVAVAPEHRGRGVVRSLLLDQLQEMRAAGQCRPADGAVRRCTLEDVGRLDQVYRTHASSRNGWVSRRPAWWERSVLRQLQGTHAVVWENASGEARGYLIYRLGGDMLKQKLTVREWVALGLDAWRGLAAFLAQHNTVAQIWWTAPADDVLLAALADPRISESRILPRHMFRLVDVAAALAQRPYPAHVRTELLLEVRDAAAPWNEGRYSLRIEEGRARVAPVVSDEAEGAHIAGRLSCDIQTLSQLYCGYLSPRQAAELGRLRADRPEALDAAQHALAIDKPHMSDYF